jgi:hypothetical protein
MAGQRTTFNKLQRERAKKAKAAVKRERRHDRLSGGGATGDANLRLPLASDEAELSAPRLLELIETIHREYQAGTLSHEEFEEKKTELLARLPVD